VNADQSSNRANRGLRLRPEGVPTPPELAKPSFELWDSLNGVKVQRGRRPGFFLMLARHLQRQRQLKDWLGLE
jgi:hypothetical protein